MSEELKTFLTVASIWLVCLIMVRYTIRAKVDAGERIDEAFSGLMQVFAPLTVVLIPLTVFVLIPLYKAFTKADDAIYSIFKKLLLKLSK